jgi:hypothetical protein
MSFVIGIVIGMFRGTPGGGTADEGEEFSPSLDFSDARNSQYIGQVV